MREIKKAEVKGSPYKMPFSMVLVSSDDVLVHSPTGCRDYLHDIIKCHMNGKVIDINQYGVNSYYSEHTAPDVCEGRLRLMFSLDDGFEAYFESAMRTLNAIEDYAELPPSSYEEVLYDGDEYRTMHYFLVEGSAEYVHNPHLLSLLTFVLRFIVKNRISEHIDSAEAFIGKIDDLNKKYSEGLSTFADYTIATGCRSTLLKVLKNRKSIFAGITRQQFYPKRASERYHSEGGILSLCQAKSHIYTVNGRVAAL